MVTKVVNYYDIIYYFEKNYEQKTTKNARRDRFG